MIDWLTDDSEGGGKRWERSTTMNQRRGWCTVGYVVVVLSRTQAKLMAERMPRMILDFPSNAMPQSATASSSCASCSRHCLDVASYYSYARTHTRHGWGWLSVRWFGSLSCLGVWFGNLIWLWLACSWWWRSILRQLGNA